MPTSSAACRARANGAAEDAGAEPSPDPPSKDSILKQADRLRDLARRARRLSESVNEGDRRRLSRTSRSSMKA
jgi:hypothetical protein